MLYSVYECNFFGKTVEWNVQRGIIKSKSCKNSSVSCKYVFVLSVVKDF